MASAKKGFVNTVDTLSYGALFMFWILNILVFALFYAFCAFFPGHGPVATGTSQPIHDFWSFIYFSVITATSTGYGDIVPVGFSRAFASIQSFSGLMLLALFVTKLLSRRQDIALTEVHELSFQTAFHNMREDLYTARKDIDLGIEAIAAHHHLKKDEWEQISIAFLQIGNLLHEIPGFYEHENELYTIDSRREKLLIEAVERTLMRVSQFVHTAKTDHDNSVRLDERVRNSLLEMIAEGEYILPTWRKHAAQSDSTALSQVHDTLDQLKEAAKHY